MTEIADIHRVQLDLLVKFDEICKILQLHYTLSSGTLLGAVRHKGFIPWDDDIDVAMPRKDYDVFVSKANALLPEGYFLQHFTTEKDCPNTFAKLKNSNTTWIAYEYRNLNINNGIGMDVFPIDRVDNPKSIKKIARKTLNLIRMKNCCDLSFIRTIKNKKKKIIAYLIFPLVKLVGRRRFILKADRFNRGNGTGDWTTADVIFRNKMMHYRLFEEYEQIEFEGKLFDCIKDRDSYLKTVYGENYMELPPEEKRVVHLAQTVDCNISYLEYLKNRTKEKKI